jgi:DNA-binding CsgD family transcriptional regulator
LAGGALAHGLAAWQLLAAGTSLAVHPSLPLLPLFSSYVLYLYCFLILLRHRRGAAGSLARGAHRTAVIGMAIVIPAMALEDLYLLTSPGSRRVLADPLAFLFLTGATLVLVMLFLVRFGRQGRQREGLDELAARYALSPREQEVAGLLAAGLRYKEIADKLCISLDTVKTHASHIYQKTASSGRVELRLRLKTPPG